MGQKESPSFLGTFPEFAHNTAAYVSLLEPGHMAMPSCKAEGVATPNKIRVWLQRKDIRLGIYLALPQIPISKLRPRVVRELPHNHEANQWQS